MQNKTKKQLLEEAKSIGLSADKSMTKREIEKLISDQKEKTSKESKLITSLDDLRLVMVETKLNPLEKMTAVQLLMGEHEFYVQYRVDCPEGWIISGRKYFVCDFYIPKLHLVIETEGKVHVTEENWIKDRNKTNTLNAMGFYVFRLSWDDIMSDVDWIGSFIEELDFYLMDVDYDFYKKYSIKEETNAKNND